MVFPIRSNIFAPGSPSQRYFAGFPIQVAILFKPSDTLFVNYLKENFSDLHEKTGKNIAFFAVLDPPQEWLNDRRNSRWWKTYQRNVGNSLFTTDDQVLMREIGRLFGIPWYSFPAIVVSTNLWQAEYVSCPTSSDELEVQLSHLEELPDLYGTPNIQHIFTTLQSICGDEVDYQPPNEAIRNRFTTLYKILNIYSGEDNENIDYRRELISREFDIAKNSLDSLRQNYLLLEDQNSFEDTDYQYYQDTATADAVIEDAVGRLIAPASVAAKVLGNFHDSVDLSKLLDDESAVMIKTSLTVGSWLEKLAEDRHERLERLKQLGILWSTNPLDIDFTPGTQGIWKAFEREVNLSVIQAARAARDIPMPTYFKRYFQYPKKKKNRGVVITGKGKNNTDITVNINQRDPFYKADKPHHRFISLGPAFYVVKAMTKSPDERLDSIIQECIGRSLPDELMTNWEEIIRIRNQGSHIEPIKMQDYQKLVNIILAKPSILKDILNIKNVLKSRNPLK